MTPDAQMYERIKALVEAHRIQRKRDEATFEYADTSLELAAEEVAAFAMEQYEARQWRPIESAPRGSSRVLVAYKQHYGAWRVREAWWRIPYDGAPIDKGWWCIEKDGTLLDASVHGIGAEFWMPLPPAPTAATPDMEKEG